MTQNRELREMGQYATAVVDPPWNVNTPGYTDHEFKPALVYPHMSTEDIMAMPLQDVLANDAWVFLWTTSRFLDDALTISRVWGLAYSFTMVWQKGGGPQFPGGPCFNGEFIIVGRRGSPKFRDTKGFRAVNFWERTGHSEKPEGFYDLLRRVTPGPRLDVFGRRVIAGFESWGNEAPEGPALPDHYQQVLV